MDKADTEKQDTRELLAQAGLPQFELGQDGYPLPGKVVKYYREHMKYTDRDGKEKHWTQTELAQRLDLSEVQVCNMENHHQGLDSLERRRTLITILRIPPVLLGLGSLDLIVEIAAGKDAIIPKQASTKRAKVNKDTIKLYQNTLSIYDTLYDKGLSYASMHDMDKWITRVERDVKYINIEDKNALLRVLWDYEILCAKIYGSDLQNWNKAFEHIDNALEVASELDDRDLQAASFYMRSVYHFRQGRIGLAKIDIDGALMYAKGGLPQRIGKIYSHNACVHANDTSLSGIRLVQNMFDGVEKYTDVKNETGNISLGKDTYLLDRAYTLIDIGRPAKALDLLDDAERCMNSSYKRYLVFIDIMRAKCYINLKKPEYEQAVRLLEGAIADSRELRVARNIDHIEKLYRKLAESSYSKAPDVIDLGIALRDLRER